jgi:hypothetical protein
MKNTILLFMIILAITPLSAQWQISAVGQLSTGVEGQVNTGSVNTGFKNLENNIAGFGSEFVWDKYGFEWETKVTFNQDEQLDWYSFWSSNFNFNYHLFGVEGFLDPYVGIGFGSSGSVNIDCAERGEFPYYDYLQLTIHSHLQAGLAFAVDNLYIGGKLSYYPGMMPIPGTKIPGIDQEDLRFTFYAGFAFGSRNFKPDNKDLSRQESADDSEKGITISIDFGSDED